MSYYPSNAGYGAQSNKTEEGGEISSSSFTDESGSALRAGGEGFFSRVFFSEGRITPSDPLGSSWKASTETMASRACLNEGGSGEGDLRLRPEGEWTLSVNRPFI